MEIKVLEDKVQHFDAHCSGFGLQMHSSTPWPFFWGGEVNWWAAAGPRTSESPPSYFAMGAGIGGERITGVRLLRRLSCCFSSHHVT